MNDVLAPFFARRYEMSEDEAAAVARALAEDPSLRQWLREQLEMEDLIARLLQPERGDFANRVRSSLDHGRDTDRFVARVRDLVTSQTAARPRTASQRVKNPGRALQFPHRLLSPWGLAACATVLVLVTAALVVGMHPASRHQVLQGDIAVGNDAVHDIPEGRDFTVTGNAPAVVRLGVGAQAEFSPASTARIRTATPTSGQVVQLGTGSGDFQLGKGNQELRVETALGSIIGSGSDAAFTATFDATPAPTATTTASTSGRPAAPADAPPNGVLTVTVRNGSAHVEVHGKKQLILADEARVFSMVGGALTDERSFKGQLKSLTPSGPVANVTISDHSNKLITIAITPTTLVRINDLPAMPSDLKLGAHLEVRAAKDTPTIATLIIVVKHKESAKEAAKEAAKKAEGAHPAASIPAAPH